MRNLDVKCDYIMFLAQNNASFNQWIMASRIDWLCCSVAVYVDMHCIHQWNEKGLHQFVCYQEFYFAHDCGWKCYTIVCGNALSKIHRNFRRRHVVLNCITLCCWDYLLLCKWKIHFQCTKIQCILKFERKKSDARKKALPH